MPDGMVRAGDPCRFVEGRGSTHWYCDQPAEHHYEWRHLIAPPEGTHWSVDREYYPGHTFVPDREERPLMTCVCGHQEDEHEHFGPCLAFVDSGSGMAHCMCVLFEQVEDDDPS